MNADDGAGLSPAGALRHWFERALQIAPEAREDWLLRHVADGALRNRIRALLQADGRAAPFLARPAGEFVQGLDREADATGHLVGTSIGPFRLLSVLGEGGSAIVFRAERDIGDGVQTVALKLLRTGLYTADAQRRFRREQRLLAELTHPNLTSLVDAGISEAGVPYIAMEFVDGQPITEYAETRRLGIEGRLRLMTVVCRAVDSAHRALVVHRDLKPSNVLVDREGHVEVLDFGIAKLLGEGEDATLTEHIALTPGYAAPEQYRSDPVTTAADVYALGVMLCELLTGMRSAPGRRRAAEASPALPSQRLAAEHDGQLPAGLPARSALVRGLRGDLDAILSTAMANEPERRYGSAGRLADDLERHLAGAPVLAHAPSRRYRWGKFLRRHRMVLILGGLAGLASTGGLVMTLWQTNEALKQAQRALVARDFLTELMDAAKAELPRDQLPSPEALVRAAATRLEARDDLRPEVRMELLQTLGEVSVANGDYVAADRLYDQAMAIGRRIHSAGEAELLHLQLLRAALLLRTNRYRDASQAYEEVLPWIRQADSAAKVEALLNYPSALMYSARADEALAFIGEAADKAAAFHGPDSAKGIAANLMRGRLLVGAGRHAEAAAVLDKDLARWRAQALPPDADFLQATRMLAAAREYLGESMAAEALHRDAVAIARNIYDEPHDRIAVALLDLGESLLQQERLDEAEQVIDEAMEMFTAVFGRAHMRVSNTLQTLSALHLRQRRFALSEQHAREALAWCASPELHATRTCIVGWTRLGEVLLATGRLDDADAALVRASDMADALFADGHPYAADALRLRSEIKLRRGEASEAVDLCDRALAIYAKLGLTAGEGALMARYRRAVALAALGRHQAALDDVDAALDAWLRLAPEGGLRTVDMLGTRAALLVQLQRHGPARDTARKALGLVRDRQLTVPSEMLETLAAIAARP